MSEKRILAKQFRYLEYLKRLDPKKLYRRHQILFKRTKYYVDIPKWMHRSVLERRLFYLFCMENYHYPKKHPIELEFRRKAKYILSADYLKDIDPLEFTEKMVKEKEYFTDENIKAMPISDVDRYLAGLSLFVEADEESRRNVLYEWFNSRREDLIEHYSKQGLRVKAHSRGELNNKFSLQELILKHPSVDYDQFMALYANKMPTVTRASFNNARSILRKRGYTVPVIPKRLKFPVVSEGNLSQQASSTDTESN